MMPNAPIMAAKREQARYYGIEMMPSDRYTQSGQKAVFGIGQRRNTLKSRYLSAAFFCPAGCVLRYSKQGLCVPKSQSKAADFLAALFFEG